MKSPAKPRQGSGQNPDKGPRRGIRYFTREGRPKPYLIEWRPVAGGAPKVEGFATKEARDIRGRDLAKAKREALPSLERAELLDWQAFSHAIGDSPWQDVVAGWREFCRIKGIQSSKRTVREASVDYIAHSQVLLDRKQIAPDTFRHRRQKANLLADSFGNNLLSSLTGPQLEAWIEVDLEQDDPSTFNNYRKHLGCIFTHFKKEIPFNPIEEIKPRQDSVEHITLLSIEETTQLFRWAEVNGRGMIGRLALEAFAGLRFSSAAKIEKADINFKDRGILLPAAKLKTKKRQYVDGFPPPVWAWLELANDACWTLTPAEYMHEKSKAFAGAKVTNPGNALRHGFASYHAAHFRDPGAIAILLCHTNQAKLWSNYKGRATQADGARYWEILPAQK